MPELIHALVKANIPKETGEGSTALVVRGRKFTPAKVKRYLQRSKDFRSTVGRIESSAGRLQRLHTNQRLRNLEQFRYRLSSGNAMLPRIDPPDDVRLPEAVIHVSYQFIAGSCESIWLESSATSDLFYSAAIIDWSDNITLSTHLIQQGCYKQAFDVVNVCLDQFKNLLINPTPTLFMGIYVAIIWLPPEISQRLLSYAAHLSAIVLPENHPLRLILTGLSRAGVEQVTKHSWLIMRSHLRILEELFPESEKIMLELNNLLSNYLNALNVGPPNAVEIWQREIIQRSELSGFTESVLQSKLSLAWTFCLSGNHDQVCIRSEANSCHTIPYCDGDDCHPFVTFYAPYKALKLAVANHSNVQQAAVIAREIWQRNRKEPSYLSHVIKSSCQALVARIRLETGRSEPELPLNTYKCDRCSSGICKNLHMIPAMKAVYWSKDE